MTTREIGALLFKKNPWESYDAAAGEPHEETPTGPAPSWGDRLTDRQLGWRSEMSREQWNRTHDRKEMPELSLGERVPAYSAFSRRCMTRTPGC